MIRAIVDAMVDLRDRDGSEALCVLTIEPSRPADLWRFRFDAESASEGFDSKYVVGAVLREVSVRAVRSIGDIVTLHAAALARDGRAIVFAGRSHAGKTTIAASLMLAGWHYLSDDVAPLVPTELRQLLAGRDAASADPPASAIDLSVTVIGFPRPLSLRPGSTRLLADHIEPWNGPGDEPAERYVAASRFGTIVAQARLSAFVLIDPEAATPTEGWPLERLSPGRALLELARCTHGDTPLDRHRLQALAAIGPLVPTFRVGRPDPRHADQLARSVLAASVGVEPAATEEGWAGDGHTDPCPTGH